MEALSRECVILKKFSVYIDELLNRSSAFKVARLDDVYDYIRHKEDFQEQFPTAVHFSRFMRKMHNKGLLKQFVKNCTVDTTIFHHYQWRFFPKDRIIKKETTVDDLNVADSHPTKTKMMPWDKKYRAANGVTVRSKQELYILNQLLAVDFFEVSYELPVSFKRQKKYPDFTIRNKVTGTTFLWEHFGINNESEYGERMVDKLKWYRKIGFKSIEEGGVLAVTIYQNDEQFVASVLKLIEQLKIK